MKQNYNNNTELPYNIKTITDMYNTAHGTGYQPQNLKFVNHSFYNLNAIGILGWKANQFAIINYSLHDNTSEIIINWGGNLIQITQNSIKDKLEGVMFDQYTQQVGQSQLYLYIMEWV